MVLEKLKSRFGLGVEQTRYTCTDCGNVFSSAKPPERANCPVCDSTNLEPAEI